MIKKFSDYDKIQVFEGGASIEPGGYELRIIGAKVEQFTNCEIMKVAFDIINHEQYAGYYSARFKAAKDQNPDAKWGGVFDVFIPKDDGSEKDGYTKQAFKRFITAVEKSNDGFVWNWDEGSLKGKVFGGVFGREEFMSKEGEKKFSVKCRFARSIESIRTGDYTLPKDKLLDDKKQQTGVVPQYSQHNALETALPPEQPQMDYGNLNDYEEILSDGPVPF